jgi:DNA helicase-2/ATP-dependent DNA helicase PcrA
MKKILLKKTSAEAHSTPSRNYTIRYGDELNAAQLEAVMHDTGAALIIAGAGTGKTRTLIYRVARLIEDGVQPETILLLTFTRKSASEMLRRATHLLDGRCEAVSGGTFHSFAHSVLRRSGRVLEAMGYGANFSVIDQSDAEDVVNLLRAQVTGQKDDGKKSDKKLGEKADGFDANKRRFPRKQALYDIFSTSANCQKPLELVVKDDYPQYEQETPTIQRLHGMYADYKRRYNLMDYDDLLVRFLELCKANAEFRRGLQARYRYIMVDEYQDTNQLQHDLVMQLAGHHENVMAVGDDAQSIYSFRGANFENIMHFPDSFRHCAVIKLEENFRSTQPILSLTNEIISRAAVGYTKELYSRKSGSELPAIVRTANEQQQSLLIVQQVLELREQGTPLAEIAVLVRSGFHSFDLELELNRANIPYQKFGGFKFVETAHIKDIIAHLRVIANPRDAVSWNRILLLLEGVGPRTAARVIDALTEGVIALDDAQKLNAVAKGDENIRRLFTVLAQATANTQASKMESVGEIAWHIIEYYRPLLKKKYDDYKKRLKDIETFGGIAERYRSITSLLSDMAIEPPVESVEDVSPSGTEDEFLTISTIHSAKGLEWGVVFVPWVLDGRFPPVRSFDTPDNIEEERRLMYVACTRAKERLYLTYPINIFDRESGMVLGKVSRFIEGIPEAFADYFQVSEEE